MIFHLKKPLFFSKDRDVLKAVSFFIFKSPYSIVAREWCKPSLNNSYGDGDLLINPIFMIPLIFSDIKKLSPNELDKFLNDRSC